MDRNFILGLVLIFLIVLGWQYYFGPEPQPEQPVAAAPDSTRTAAPQPEQTVTIRQAPDSTTAARELQDKLGRFAAAAEGTDRVIRISTAKHEFQLHTKGGYLQPVVLKNFRTYDSLPYPVLPAGPDHGYQVQFVHNNRVISTRDLVFQPVGNVGDITLAGNDSQTVTLRASIAPGQHLDQVYTFHGDRYDVGYRIQTTGLADVIRDRRMEMQWRLHVPRTEKNANDQRNKTGIYYYYGGDIGNLSTTDTDPLDETITGEVKWVSLRTQFFTTAVLAPDDTSIPSAQLTSNWEENPELYVKYLTARLDLDVDHAAGKPTALTLYFGPTDHDVMAAYDNGFEDQLDLGWWGIRPINYGVLFVFRQLEKLTLNYGIIIAVLALIIKLVLSPLTWRSYVSNAKMQLVNNMPEVKEIDAKYADDPAKQQAAKMQFYQSVGVSPFAGCIPLLLQLPILLAMFSFFPQSIELRGASFLWADDLSTYDEIVKFQFSLPFLGSHISGFAVLMTISQLIYTWVSQRGQTLTGPAAQMRFLGYVFPIVFFVVLNNYSAGLSYYYFVINVLTIVQTFVIKALIDENKLHEQIAAVRNARTKGGTVAPKPNRLARWLEDQQKKQQSLLQERQQQARKGGASGNAKGGKK